GKIENELKSGRNRKDLKKDIDFLHYELEKEQAYSKKTCSVLNDITVDAYNENTARAIKDYLGNTLKNHYINVDIAARKKHNALTLKLIKGLGNDGLVNLKDSYENESLTQLVKN